MDAHRCAECGEWLPGEHPVLCDKCFEVAILEEIGIGHGSFKDKYKAVEPAKEGEK